MGKKQIYLLCIALIALCKNTQNLTASGNNKQLINVPVAGIYTQLDKQSSYDSQKIYGHSIEIIEFVNDTWVKVKTNDGIINYMQKTDLIQDNLSWRTSENLQRIKSLIGCVYPTQSVKNVPIIRLPYNAYVNVINLSDDDYWALVELIDHTIGWIMTGNIESIEKLSCKEIIERSKQFIGLPYIWGGASSFGFDCSGLTSTLAQQMGYPMKRDAWAQAEDENLINVPYNEIQPGDFVYFGEQRITHVALCIEIGKIIHATVIQNNPQLIITSLDLPHLVFNCARRIPDNW